MSAQIIDGRARARLLKQDLAAQVTRLREDRLGIGLATVMVGDGFSSAAYERRLRRLAAELGVHYVARNLPDAATEADLVAAVAELNAPPEGSGILVLRPL